ncbi:GspH/FimT family pseudopilin [Endozoicomonas sp.]|uniref:GspH/FimT family pseudopilin n=1 Tax=Endozoicomonas sp. TaxID=1892382 RepID=UPI00383A3F75
MSVCPGRLKDKYFSRENAAADRSAAADRKCSNGFTLIELMISLILMGLLVNLVIPFSSVLETFRLDYINQRLYSSAVLARSEAIKRSVNVSVCQSDSGTACDGQTSWANGWVIFVDINDDNVIDSGEEVIRVYNEITSPVDIEWSNGNRLTFVPRGSSGTAGNFTVCPDRGGTPTPRQVTVSGTGLVQRSTGTGSC